MPETTTRPRTSASSATARVKAPSSEQLAYAASDVLHLHALWTRLEALLRREGRLELALSCYDFLPTRARLDVLGWEQPDIFAH